MQHSRIISLWLVMYDLISICCAYFLALWMRFDFRFSMIPEEYMSDYLTLIPFYAVFCIFVFRMLHLYQSIWRFVSYNEFIRVCVATVITWFSYVCISIFTGFFMPLSYYAIGLLLQITCTLGIRFSYRFVLLLRKNSSTGLKNKKNVGIIGAGAAGHLS